MQCNGLSMTCSNRLQLPWIAQQLAAPLTQFCQLHWDAKSGLYDCNPFFYTITLI